MSWTDLWQVGIAVVIALPFAWMVWDSMETYRDRHDLHSIRYLVDRAERELDRGDVDAYQRSIAEWEQRVAVIDACRRARGHSDP